MPSTTRSRQPMTPAGPQIDPGCLNEQLATFFSRVSTWFAGDGAQAIHPDDLHALEVVMVRLLEQAAGLSESSLTYEI